MSIPVGTAGSGSRGSSAGSGGGPGLGVSEVPWCPPMEVPAVRAGYLPCLPSFHLSLKCSCDNSV